MAFCRGGYTGFWLNGKWKSRLVTSGSEGDVKKTDYTFDDDGPVQDQRFDAGVVFGTGIGFGAGGGNIEVDLRYNMGLMDRLKYEDGRPDGINKQMNRNFGLSVLYLF